MKRLASAVWEIPGALLGIAIGAVLHFIEWRWPGSIEKTMRPDPG